MRGALQTTNRNIINFSRAWPETQQTYKPDVKDNTKTDCVDEEG